MVHRTIRNACGSTYLQRCVNGCFRGVTLQSNPLQEVTGETGQITREGWGPWWWWICIHSQNFLRHHHEVFESIRGAISSQAGIFMVWDQWEMWHSAGWPFMHFMSELHILLVRVIAILSFLTTESPGSSKFMLHLSICCSPRLPDQSASLSFKDGMS